MKKKIAKAIAIAANCAAAGFIALMGGMIAFSLIQLIKTAGWKASLAGVGGFALFVAVLYGIISVILWAEEEANDNQ